MIWPTKKLGDCLAQFDRGISWSRKDEGGTVAVLRIPNIQEGHINFHDLKHISVKNGNGELHENDIVMVASNGNPDLVGRSALVTENEKGMRFASFLVRLKFDDSKLLPQYAHLFLLTPIFKRELRRKIATTSGIYNLRKDHIEKIKIPLPPLDIQKQIVERLDKIAEAQKLNDDLIQKADELYRSLLHSELNAKFKNQSAKSQFKIKKLVDVAEIIGGFAFKSDKLVNKKIAESYLPVIKIGNVLKSGKLDISNAQYHQFDKSLEKYLIKQGDILVAMTGATVGKVVCSAYDNILLNQRVGLIRTNKDVADQDFIGMILETKQFYDYCQRTAGGGAQGNISPSQIMQYEIPLPQLKTQKQIVAKLSAAQEYKTQLLSQKSKFKELFDSVLAKSFNN